MRGTDQQRGHVFSYISPEQRVRKDHPLRPIRAMVDKVLKELSPEFDKMYSKVGRPSIPPEQLLRALLLQMLYSVRSERLLIEEIDFNILFRFRVARENEAARRVAYYGVAVALEQITFCCDGDVFPAGLLISIVNNDDLHRIIERRKSPSKSCYSRLQRCGGCNGT